MPKKPAPKSAKTMKKSVSKAKGKSKKSPAPVHERGFMWKVLKQKQSEQKQLEKNPTNPHQAGSDNQPRVHAHHTGFGRFAGPRRRAG